MSVTIEKEQENNKKKQLQMFFSKLAKLTVDMINDKKAQTIFNKYDKEEIIKWMYRPSANEKKLREVSQYLYNCSSHYKRLINYFATMPLFYYTLIPQNIDIEKVKEKKFKEEYYKMCKYIDNMNIQHELQKILIVAFREDVLFGYQFETENSYHIKQLNPDYCQITGIEDGVYNFSFDFSYFDSNKNSQLLRNPMCREFLKKYLIYKKDKRNKRWQQLDSKNTICIKVNEDLPYIMPPFAGVFEALYDVNDYKMLKKAKEELGNYQILAMKIPMKKDGVEEFLLEYETAQKFYDLALQSLQGTGIGAILTPMEIEPIKFDREPDTSDRVSEAEKMFWSSAGVNGNLFNSDGSSGAVVGLSTITDESILFRTLNQMERWVNRKLKIKFKNSNFYFKLLKVTVNNQQDLVDQCLKLAQYGIPVKTELCGLLGYSPNKMKNMTWLENEVLNLHDKWKPLQSTHTQNDKAKTENGRPEKNIEETARDYE